MNMRTANDNGFSLIELMVVLAIATILLGIGVPAFAAMLRNQRVTTAVNDLFAAIHLARSEAVQRGQRVDLMPSDGNNWANGWIIFIDENGNHQVDNGEAVLFTHDAIPKDIGISSALTDASFQYIAYNGTGRTRTDASDQQPQVGTLSFSLAGVAKRRIKLNFLGRPRTCDPESDLTCTGTADAK